MSEWKEYKLGDIIVTNAKSITKDYPYKKIKYLDTGSITCNKIESLQDLNLTDAPSRAKRLVNDGDIIYSTVRPDQLHYGYITSAPQNLVVSTGFVTITCNKEIVNPKFLYYSLTQNQTTEFLHSIAEASTSTYPSLKPSDIEALDIILPPLPEQEHIASILSSLDDKIDLLNRQNQTLESMAETLFRHYFIDNAQPDWEEKSLGELVEINGGFSYKGEYIGAGVSLLLGMGCVSFNKRFLSSGARPYSGECPEKYLVNPGDLVIATRQQSDNMPILGFPAIIPDDFKGKKVIVGANLYNVKNNSKLSNYFFYLLLRTSDYQNHIIACSKGTTVKMITKDAIESYQISLPPIDIIIKYQDVLNSFNQKVNTISNQICTLTKLREIVLPKLMNSEIKID